MRVTLAFVAMLALGCARATPAQHSPLGDAASACGEGGIVVPLFGADARTRQMRQVWSRWEGTHVAVADIACAEDAALACTPRTAAHVELELQLGYQPACDISACDDGALALVAPEGAECGRVITIPVQVAARISDTPLDVLAHDERLFVFPDGHVELRVRARNPPSVRQWLAAPHDMGVFVNVTLERAQTGTYASLSIDTEQVDGMVCVTGVMSAGWTIADSP